YMYPSKLELGTEIFFNYLNRSFDWLDAYGDFVLGAFTENRKTLFKPYTGNTSGSRLLSLRGGISRDLVFGQTNFYVGAGLLFTGSAWGERPLEGLGDAFWSNTRFVGYTVTVGGLILGGIIVLATSDNRLKDSVEKIGVSLSGINIYKFKYKGHPETFVGVMAQEVLETHPHAVFTMPNGYYAVAYDMLDVPFFRLD
ncbi:MAG: tail fiber domain-containing protein, partial [Myxococcota bacterium]|nr:tail fiber domain-containing protein [Myxococcota bacterium]